MIPSALLPFACACTCTCAGGWVLYRAYIGRLGPPRRGLGLPPRDGMPPLAKAPMRRHRTKALMPQSCAPLPADEPWDITAITTQRPTAHQHLSLWTPPPLLPFLSRVIAATALAGRRRVTHGRETPRRQPADWIKEGASVGDTRLQAIKSALLRGRQHSGKTKRIRLRGWAAAPPPAGSHPRPCRRPR